LRKRASEHLFDRLVEEREPLVSRGGPFSAEAVQRGLHHARGRLTESKACSDCPAAQMVGDRMVRCAIERVVFSERSDPMTLLSFCLGDYRACPTWALSREMDWAGKGRQFERSLVGA
jgi:hypothetical protein